MDKKWPKETHVPELIIVVLWQLVVQSANKYVTFIFCRIKLVILS